MPRILHIANESGFLKLAKYQFELLMPNESDYFVVTNSKDQVGKIEGAVKYISGSSSEVRSIVDVLGQYDLVLLHMLDRFKSQIVNEYPDYPNYMWVLWGTEVYDEPYLYQSQVINPKTYKFHRRSSIRLYLKSRFKQLKHSMYQLGIMKHPIGKALQHIHYVGNMRMEEFQDFKKRQLLPERTEYCNFTYGALSELVDVTKEEFVTSNNILIGNSASASNNHIELIDRLSNCELGDSIVYVPLSYGHKEYGQKVGDYGKEKIGSKFNPLFEYLPIREYEMITKSCSHILFNHRRQQALGNILNGLWAGSKIFLDTDNILYAYLTNNGFQIYAINEISKENVSWLDPLALPVQESNRKRLLELYGDEIVLNHLKEDLARMLD